MVKDFHLNFVDIDNREVESVRRVLLSRHLERGSVTKFVEKKLKHLINVKNAVLVSNATGALIAGLKASGIGFGDEVLTTPFTFAATVNAISLVGAVPVYVDIDPETFNLDPEKIEEKISRRTKAILTVDLFGLPCDYEKIGVIAKKHNLVVIADSSQAFGSLFNNKYFFPNVSLQVFSFFISKVITAGEGGLAITNNKEIADNFNIFINHGQKRGSKYKFIACGWNFRPTDIEAAIIKSQLGKLNRIISKRKRNARYLTQKLKNTKGLILPSVGINREHSFSRYTVRIGKDFRSTREQVINYLRKNGVETDVIYPKPLYFYKHLSFGFGKGSCLESERASREVLTIPVHQNLTNKDLGHICKCIKDKS